jgi:putative transposase
VHFVLRDVITLFCLEQSHLNWNRPAPILPGRAIIRVYTTLNRCETMVDTVESRTIQLKLLDVPVKEFDDTISAYLDALNYVSEYSHKKHIYSSKRLQQTFYEKIRKRFKIKSQMAVNVFRQVSASYRTAKKNGYKWEEPINFTKNTVTFNYPRDFTFRPDNVLSINTLKGRKKVKWTCGKHQLSYLENGWTKRSGKLIKRGKDYYLYVTVIKDFKVNEVDYGVTVVGADLGINNILVATNNHKTYFAKGGEVKDKKGHYQRVTASLQSKGTRPAKRVLQRVSGREKRFMKDINHQVSKRFVEWVSGFEKPIIALEDLSNIRKRLGVKNGKTTKSDRKRINRWSFYQLRMFIEYKARQLGIPVIYVDPKWTSQHCPKCGHTEEDNRDRSRFECLRCHYKNNADVVASINIRSKATDLRYILESAGSPSMTPEVAIVDAETNFVRTEAEVSHKPPTLVVG